VVTGAGGGPDMAGPKDCAPWPLLSNPDLAARPQVMRSATIFRAKLR
jgi:hypothetical protein